MKLTPSQQRALDFADRNDGAVFAGANVERRGSMFHMSASVIFALERRGLVTRRISPDGGVVGIITDAGRAALRA